MIDLPRCCPRDGADVVIEAGESLSQNFFDVGLGWWRSQWVVVVDVGERASDRRNDVSPHPRQGGAVPVPVGEASDSDGPGGFGIVCADKGKDGPVASGYGEYARCKIRHPISLNVRISARCGE